MNFTEQVLSFLSLGGFCFVSRLLLADRWGVCKHSLKADSRQQCLSAAQAAPVRLRSRDRSGGWSCPLVSSSQWKEQGPGLHLSHGLAWKTSGLWTCKMGLGQLCLVTTAL